jgi:hypothetical protein
MLPNAEISQVPMGTVDPFLKLLANKKAVVLWVPSKYKHLIGLKEISSQSGTKLLLGSQ